MPGFFRSIRFSAGYDDLSTSFVTGANASLDAYDDVAGTYTTVETEQRADFTLRCLRASVEAEFTVAPLLRLKLGPNIDIPLSGTSRERELILSPSNATFLDRTQEREIAEGTGDLSSMTPRIGVAAGVGYRLPLGGHLFFEPHLDLDYGITRMQPDWSPLLVRGGIDIGYAFIEEAPPPPSEPAPPVAAVPAPAPEAPRPAPFDASLDVNVSAAKLPIEFRRQIVARYVPVLPVIFFEKNSSQLPERYLGTTDPATFTEASVAPEAIAAHRQVLAIIGRRLKENPRAAVTLTGTTSSDEENRKMLAEARAERVASLLAGTWGIDRSRITVRSSVDPAVPSNSDYPEGRAENRRVEFEFNEASLYNPIQLRVVEPTTEPRSIDFTTSVSATRPVERWELALNSPAAPIDALRGIGSAPSIITWDLTTEDRERVLTAGVVDYHLSVYDSLGRYVNSTTKSLPVRVDTTVTVTSSASRPVNEAEFLLVTFEYDRAQLTRRGMEEMKAILARIGPNSHVSIVGYTDALGDVAHNRALAEDRARRIASLLPAGTNVEVRGASPEEAPYKGDAPESRFLSRTVRVIVVNPK
jgi:outer membrane protein OmpA-like peptidoglycan-associated protein